MKDETYAVIGKSVPRVDGAIKAKGEAIYTTDITLPGMLHGKILRSPHPHAKILRIDTSKAERLKGVKAVITGRDIPKVKCGVVMLVVPDSADRYLLAQDRVRFIGEDVAAVAATSEDLAEEALGLIEVDYEVLPSIFSIAEATKPDAPLLHEKFPGNISAKTLMDFGNVEKGFEESDYVREDRFTTQLVHHCFMEPHVSVANFESSGKLTLWSATQTPFIIKNLLPILLGIPDGNVRVIKPCLGGGFGGKVGVYPFDLCSALLSKKSGKPVKLCLTREEEFTASRRRHPMEIDLKIGVKRDGRIMALKAKIMCDGGAYDDGLGPVTTLLSTLFLTISYRLPNIKLESQRVYTNKITCGPMRGYTAVQVQFAAETLMDLAAEELGIDPVEIRMINGSQAGDTTVNGLNIRSGSLNACLEKVSERSEWKKKYRPYRSDHRKPPPLKGMGVAGGSFFSGTSFPLLGSHTASSTILIKAQIDGTVIIFSGASDIGQGSDTILSQIAAEELGIRMEDVKITIPDTDLTPPDLVSTSSRVTLMAGNAAKRAGADLKQKLFKAVAEKLEANAQDLEARDGRIYIKGSPEQGVSFMEAVAICQTSHKGMMITGEGSYDPSEHVDPLDVVTGHGNHSPTYKFAAMAAEVEVDQDTGRVKVNKLAFADDCGRAINPMSVEGQLDGSACLGISYALYEKLIVENGKTLNPGFLEYKMPTVLEMPEMENLLVESIDPTGPFGAKESGEGLVAPVAPAILNAIYNATGLRFKDLPVTPEMILRGLKKKGEGCIF